LKFCSGAVNKKSTAYAPHFRNFAYGEYTHALRLVSKLPDLRAGYADRILPPAAAERGTM
jgi:hypothetical protein